MGTTFKQPIEFESTAGGLVAHIHDEDNNESVVSSGTTVINISLSKGGWAGGEFRAFNPSQPQFVASGGFTDTTGEGWSISGYGGSTANFRGRDRNLGDADVTEYIFGPTAFAGGTIALRDIYVDNATPQLVMQFKNTSGGTRTLSYKISIKLFQGA
jgi:hypothetical protein